MERTGKDVQGKQTYEEPIIVTTGQDTPVEKSYTEQAQ